MRRLAFGRFQFDPANGDLSNESGLVPLTPKALALLEYLASRPGRVVTTRELHEKIWADVFVGDGALKVCVREIRRALGDEARHPRFIETVHRRGYRFIASVQDIAAPARPDVSGPIGASSPIGVTAAAAESQPTVRVQYARSGDVNIAYQVLGSGPVDLVFVMGWVSHLEYYWREPAFARFLQRLASFSRLILFDKRGTGLSDPVTHMPTLEQRMDDVRAVMDAVGSTRAVLLGVSEGGPMSALFAATHPSRTAALVMIGTYARRIRTDDYPWAPTEEQREAFCREILADWGGPVGIHARAPTQAHDPQFRNWWATYLRMGASPASAVALTRMNAQIDVRHILPAVRVPSLVLHRRGDRCLSVEEGRYVASRIPGARFVELPGDDHLPFVGDADRLLEEIERFVVQTRQRSDEGRRLATMLCLRDGLVILFDGPARAIRCGHAMAAAAAARGMLMQIGVHVGECALIDGAAGGLAVEIGRRLAEHAQPGEILVSRTVVDLVAGSGLSFTYRGALPLAEGLHTWQVFASAGGERETPSSIAHDSFRIHEPSADDLLTTVL